ncbi:MAG: hypothetical protein RLZZ437_3518 [Pseudomonadota bacterium]
MYRVSPALNRLALALLSGSLIATVWAFAFPASYYDAAEWRILDLQFPTWLASAQVVVTPITIVGEAAMALFVALIAKELWEAIALERGPLAGRHVVGPLALMFGGILGAVVVWGGLVLALGLHHDMDGYPGWTAPIGSDVVLCYLFGRMIFGAAHPALKLILLISIAETLVGLTLAGLFSPASDLRPLWLIVPVGSALFVWWRFGNRNKAGVQGRPIHQLRAVWPYIIAGVICWAAVLAAGLPGALGLLPILPAVAHADRSFGLFAEAEGLLHDPLNRIAHLLIWPATAAMFAFGLTFGAIDPTAFGALTVIMLAALWIGKTAGLLGMAWMLQRTGSTGPLMAITRRDLWCIVPLLALSFTGPAMGLQWALPQGVPAEAARLGLALSLLAGPLGLLLARKLP